MTTIVTRAGKGSPLTHTEVDTNFTNLNTNKLEAGAIALGSAATPSISFTGDTNTGIFSPGADQLAISTNGTGRLFVDGGGITSTGGGVFKGDVTSHNVDGVALAFVSNLSQLRACRSGGNYGSLAFFTPGANSGGAQAERVRITSEGLVGIGSSSPAVNLQVNAASDVSIALSNSSSVTSGNRGNISCFNSAVSSVGLIRFAAITDNVGTEIQFHTRPAAGSLTQSMTLDSAGRLGIGTTSPACRCQIDNPVALSGSGNDYALIAGNASSASRRAVAFGVDGVLGNPVIAGYNTISTGVSSLAVDATQIEFRISGTEKAKIDGSGRLLVGTSSSIESTSKLQVKDGSLNIYHASAAAGAGYAIFFTSDGSSSALAQAKIEGLQEAANTSGGRLVFSTSASGSGIPTERMRIQSTGTVLINKTSSSFTTSGFEYRSSNELLLTSTTTNISINRLSTDGDLIDFFQDTVREGNISVSGTTVSYNGAHLSRWSQLPSGAERTEILRGSVLSNLDEMCEWGEEDNEQLNRMKVSDVEGDKNVSGVFQCWDDDDDTYTNDFYCAMTGDFIIRIAADVTVERGDLLISAGDGTAKPQDDDIIRSKTIAKVTSTNVSCTYDDGSYCVPCVLMAC